MQEIGNELVPEDWKDLHNYLFNEQDKEIGRYRSQYAYRGVSNFDFGLETSIQRIGRRPSDCEWHIIRNFQKYSPINTLIDNYNNIWNWIGLGQHHGLPTRYLDWTFSPYVALHFATDIMSDFDKDGAIWMVDFIELKKLAPLSFLENLNSKSYLSFTSNELNVIIGSNYDDIKKYAQENGDFLIFFEPPSIDDRIVNQFALFSFMLNPDTDKLGWLESHPDLYKKMKIPKKLKWEIRDKLDQANISERIIYPGLDGISRWLRRWYSEIDETKKWKVKNRK